MREIDPLFTLATSNGEGHTTPEKFASSLVEMVEQQAQADLLEMFSSFVVSGDRGVLDEEIHQGEVQAAPWIHTGIRSFSFTDEAVQEQAARVCGNIEELSQGALFVLSDAKPATTQTLLIRARSSSAYAIRAVIEHPRDLNEGKARMTRFDLLAPGRRGR